MNSETTKREEKEISFTYIEGDTPCQKGTRWDGCCCECAYRGVVHKHCWHSPKPEKGKCICKESLGFYVCTAWLSGIGEGSRRVQLSGEHGYCELFKRMKRECGTCRRGPHPDLSKYPCHECDVRNGYHAWEPRV